MRGSERSSNPRPLPDRPGGDEADLARLAQHHGGLVESCELLASGDEPIRDPVRGPLYEAPGVKCRGAWTLPSLWTPRTRPQRPGKPHRTRFPTAPTRTINALHTRNSGHSLSDGISARCPSAINSTQVPVRLRCTEKRRPHQDARTISGRPAGRTSATPRCLGVFEPSGSARRTPRVFASSSLCD